MKFCQNCGKEIKEGADICLSCGKNVNNSTVVSKELPTSSAAIVGFVFSLISVFLFPIAPIGLIISIVGMAQTKSGEKKGRGFAIAGLTIGIVFTLLLLLVVLFLVLSYATYNATVSTTAAISSFY